MRCHRLVRFCARSFFAILVTGFILGQTKNPASLRPGATPGLDSFGMSTASSFDFAPVVSYGSGGTNAHSVAVADVNGDGKPDLLVANNCATPACNTTGSVGVLLGNGDGTFRNVVTYSSGGYWANAIAVADLNGDGHPDLVVANYSKAEGSSGNGKLGVRLGNGDGTFQAVVTLDTGGITASSLAIADVNGDGKPDLIAVNECVSRKNCQSGSVAVLLGNGDGTFQPARTYASGYSPVSVAVGDLNRDGNPDIVVANSCFASSNCVNGSVSILFGSGDGIFEPAVSIDSGGAYPNVVAIADLNGDGKLDLVVGNGCTTGIDCSVSTEGVIGVLLGLGDGTFQPAVTYDPGGFLAYSLAVADINGEGKLDLVVGNYGDVGLLLGNGDGTFESASVLNVNYEATGVAVADLNRDGQPDLVVSDDASTVVGVLLNGSREGTTTNLVSSRNPSKLGQSVNLKATVTPQGMGTPTGTVSFYDGTTHIGSASLSRKGLANLQISTLTSGTHSLTANYSGDKNFSSSTSPVLNQVVAQGPQVVLSPTSLGFGSIAIGTSSGPAVATLTNIGNSKLRITSIQLVHQAGVEGEINETNNCGSALPPNRSCTISVTFSPIEIGEEFDVVNINDDAPDSPQGLPVSGDGEYPAGFLVPTGVNFGNQNVGSTSNPLPITLSNLGKAPMTVTGIQVSSQFSETDNCNIPIQVNSNCIINVTFSPMAAGTVNGSLIVTDNAFNSPQSAYLSGTGVASAH